MSKTNSLLITHHSLLLLDISLVFADDAKAYEDWYFS